MLKSRQERRGSGEQEARAWRDGQSQRRRYSDWEPVIEQERTRREPARWVMKASPAAKNFRWLCGSEVAGLQTV